MRVTSFDCSYSQQLLGILFYVQLISNIVCVAGFSRSIGGFSRFLARPNMKAASHVFLFFILSASRPFSPLLKDLHFRRLLVSGLNRLSSSISPSQTVHILKSQISNLLSAIYNL